jgi:tRNA nucleotidyltransferase (CCA-adding enzyme)
MNSLLGLNRPFFISKALQNLVAAVHLVGGRCVAVGGCVRDHLLGYAPKDIDIEVYNLPLPILEQTLKKIGAVHAAGQSFGVLKTTLSDEEGSVTFDVSLPRTENKKGRGHKGFVVAQDPDLPFFKAAARRDFTVNAMGFDLHTEELLDPYHGSIDLHHGLLKHVSDAFDEDPLRVLRACQFASRFQMVLDKSTIEKCKNLNTELFTLPKERIFEEMKKLLLGQKPSKGLATLAITNGIALFPELSALMDCPQDPIWHPEGDVWVHTLMVVDEAARIIRREKLDSNQSLIIMFGALCHDLGKPSTTQKEGDRVRSKNHEAAGEIPTRNFLNKMGTPHEVIELVVPLVREHLKPCQLYKVRKEISDSTIKRLANRVCIEQLCHVAEADFLGRTTEDAKTGVDPSVLWLKKEAERLSVSKEGQPPILMGRHLLDLKMTPGPKMGKILNAAYEAQLDGNFMDLEGALVWLETYESKSN